MLCIPTKTHEFGVRAWAGKGSPKERVGIVKLCRHVNTSLHTLEVDRGKGPLIVVTAAKETIGKKDQS